jgi:glutamate racemase
MIGFYDSGLGGLTIFSEFYRKNKNLSLCYLGDTANCPLGDKTKEEITEITKKGVEFLFSKGCNLVVLVCNTATSVAIRELQQNWLPKNYPDKNVLGVVRPVSEVLKEASEKFEDGEIEPVVVLATSATCKTGFYQEELLEAGVKESKCIPCSGLADAIENLDSPKVARILDECFETNLPYFLEAKTMVLACTHYPIIEKTIEKHLKKKIERDDVKIVSQSNMVAEKLEEYLEKHEKYRPSKGKVKIWVTEGNEGFREKMKEIFGLKHEVEEVKIA